MVIYPATTSFPGRPGGQSGAEVQDRGGLPEVRGIREDGPEILDLPQHHAQSPPGGPGPPGGRSATSCAAFPGRDTTDTGRGVRDGNLQHLAKPNGALWDEDPPGIKEEGKDGTIPSDRRRADPAPRNRWSGSFSPRGRELCSLRKVTLGTGGGTDEGAWGRFFSGSILRWLSNSPMYRYRTLFRALQG